MGFITRFLTDTCEIRPYERLGSGGPLYGAPEIRACRVEPAPKAKTVYKDPSGVLVETVAHLTLFCEGKPIPMQSLVTVHGQEMRVISCQEMNGFECHLEVPLE